MNCGIVSILHIPSAEHKALHKCSSLVVQVNAIIEGKNN